MYRIQNGYMAIDEKEGRDEHCKHYVTDKDIKTLMSYQPTVTTANRVMSHRIPDNAD